MQRDVTICTVHGHLLDAFIGLAELLDVSAPDHRRQVADVMRLLAETANGLEQLTRDVDLPTPADCSRRGGFCRSTDAP